MTLEETLPYAVNGTLEAAETLLRELSDNYLTDPHDRSWDALQSRVILIQEQVSDLATQLSLFSLHTSFQDKQQSSTKCSQFVMKLIGTSTTDITRMLTQSRNQLTLIERLKYRDGSKTKLQDLIRAQQVLKDNFSSCVGSPACTRELATQYVNLYKTLNEAIQTERAKLDGVVTKIAHSTL